MKRTHTHTHSSLSLSRKVSIGSLSIQRVQSSLIIFGVPVGHRHSGTVLSSVASQQKKMWFQGWSPSVWSLHALRLPPSVQRYSIMLEYINFPIMIPAYDSWQWSKLMGWQRPPFSLLGDSATPRQGKQDEEVILWGSVNFWTGRPLFAVSPPYTLKTCSTGQQLSGKVVRQQWCTVWIRHSAGGRERLVAQFSP